MSESEPEQIGGKTQQSIRIPFLAGATDLLAIAKRALESTSPGADAGDMVRDSNLIAIVFANLSVEGFLNELAALDWRSGQQASLVALDDKVMALRRVLRLAEDHNLQPVAKLLLAHEILEKPINRGDTPFQDYSLLKQLRDSIVHPKPSSVTIAPSKPVEFRSSRHKVLSALETRGLLSYDPVKKGQPFLNWLSNPRLGRWAVHTASAIVRTTLEALPPGEFREVVLLVYRDFSQSDDQRPNRDMSSGA